MRLRLKDDSGQGMLPLMVLVALTLLAITFSLLVPWGAATTEKAQAQTAADAAALAAVDDKRGAWLDATRPGLLTFQGHGIAQGLARVRGCDEARDYAAQNGTSLVGCSFITSRGRSGVETTVRADSTSGENGRAEARAKAVMDIDLGRCRWDVFAPEPLTAANGGPPTFDRTLVCGRWRAAYVVTNLPPYPTVSYEDTDRETLFADLEPRLVRTDLF